MTCNLMPRAGLLLAASLILASPAFAAEGRGRHDDRHGDRHSHRHQQGSWGGGLPSVVPGIGTFSGNIAATRIRGSGVYIAVDRRGGSPFARSGDGKSPSTGVKIIHVNAATARSACAWEVGVCVIRP